MGEESSPTLVAEAPAVDVAGLLCGLLLLLWGEEKGSSVQRLAPLARGWRVVCVLDSVLVFLNLPLEELVRSGSEETGRSWGMGVTLLASELVCRLLVFTGVGLAWWVVLDLLLQTLLVGPSGTAAFAPRGSCSLCSRRFLAIL